MNFGIVAFLSLLVWSFPDNSLADSFGARVDSGDTAWGMAICAMALLIIPGIACFYGGMVRTKNVVSTLLQIYFVVAVVGLLWATCGYSFAFSGDFHGIIGDFEWLFLNHVGQDPNPDYAPAVPHLLFMMYECVAAIAAPALLIGAFAERVRFKSWLIMMPLWSLFVFIPVSHWVWSPQGFLHLRGVMDSAGGLVIHITAGYSALVCALSFGPRKDFGKLDARPHDVGMVILGSGILMFGWLGFNSGSVMHANGLAMQAFTTTFFSGAAGLFMWSTIDWLLKGRPSAIGAATGIIAGLTVIAPAAGCVTVQAGIFMGLIAGGVCNFSCNFLRTFFHIDDTLNVFGCHGIGGTMGAILAGIFASKDVNPSVANGLLLGNSDLLITQLIATTVVAGFSVIGTFLIVKVVNTAVPVRVSGREEELGLDSTQHFETVNSNLKLQSVYGDKTKKAA